MIMARFKFGLARSKTAFKRNRLKRQNWKQRGQFLYFFAKSHMQSWLQFEAKVLSSNLNKEYVWYMEWSWIWFAFRKSMSIQKLYYCNCFHVEHPFSSHLDQGWVHMDMDVEWVCRNDIGINIHVCIKKLKHILRWTEMYYIINNMNGMIY